MNGLEQQFADLFRGRLDAFGTEEGGCDRDTTLSYEARIHAHLDGSRPMGVYPMRHHGRPRPGDTMRSGWWVNWGCIDFDEGEEASWAHAQNVRLVLAEFGVTAWVERSRSKGYHVWVFLDRPTNARLVRHALLGACQVVDAPTREINPKQESLSNGQLGNYVRLPYPGHAGLEPVGDRRVCVDPRGTVFSLVDFTLQAYARRVEPITLEPVAMLYKEPARPVIIPTQVTEGDMHKRMSGLAYTIWKDGPLDGSGRSEALWKFARLLAEGGQHATSEAIELVREADRAWGKFWERPNGDEVLQRLVLKAYGLVH